MKKNNFKNAAFHFLRLIVFVSLAVVIGGRILTIRSALKAIEECRNTYDVTNYITTSRLASLEREAGELRNREVSTVEIAQTMEERAAIVRKLLHNQGTRAEQFRITGKGNDAAVEFTLNCPPLPFFNFLLELSTGNAPSLAYISIKPDPVTGNIKSTLRLTNKTITRPAYGNEKEQPQTTPRDLASSFCIPDEIKKTVTPPSSASAAITPEKRTVPAEKNSFKYLGSIRDNGGKERVYIKDTDSGDIIAAESAVPVSANEDAYVVTMGGNEYIIRRN
jgi:hypothetical protein